MNVRTSVSESESGAVLYCFGRSATKHIQWLPPTEEGMATSFCGGWFETEDGMKRSYHRWYQPERAEKDIAKQLSLPTCRRCAATAQKIHVAPQGVLVNEWPTDSTDSLAGCHRDLVASLNALHLLCEKLRDEMKAGHLFCDETFEALVHAEDILENL